MSKISINIDDLKTAGVYTTDSSTNNNTCNGYVAGDYVPYTICTDDMGTLTGGTEVSAIKSYKEMLDEKVSKEEFVDIFCEKVAPSMQTWCKGEFMEEIKEWIREVYGPGNYKPEKDPNEKEYIEEEIDDSLMI